VARKAKAPVIVAKLDKLSRDVHFISGLMKHKVAFIVADLGAVCSIGERRRIAPIPQYRVKPSGVDKVAPVGPAFWAGGGCAPGRRLAPGESIPAPT